MTIDSKADVDENSSLQELFNAWVLDDAPVDGPAQIGETDWTSFDDVSLGVIG
jgi:hypothetical protein